jgi:hypothetical protein
VSILKTITMGLWIQSLENIPIGAKRDYFIYLLDYGWSEPLGEALMKNYEKMASIAAENRAVVIRGTHRVHFEDEVLSWHNINGENAEEMLPAILITNRHPIEFRESYDLKNSEIEDDLKLILIPLKKFCKNTTDVAILIEKLFNDIKNKKDLNDFRVAKETKKGFGKALADAIVLEPNFVGLGFNFNKMIEYFKTKK